MAAQVRCKVTWTDSTVAVKNLSSGREVSIDAWDVPEGWDFFSQEEKELFDLLTEGESPKEMNLSPSDMRGFLTAAERAGKVSPLQDSNTEEASTAREDQSLAKRVVDRETRKATRFCSGNQVDDVERKIKGMQEVIEVVSTEDYYLFWYYINSLSKLPNPSHLLWGLGFFRFDGSCWIGPKKKVPALADITNEWDQYKETTLTNGKVEVDYCIIRQPSEYREMFKQRARKALDEEIRRVHTSLIDCIANADETLKKVLEKEGVTWNQERKAESIRDSAIRARIRKAQEELKNCINCALSFDEMERVSDLIAALRAAINSQKESFNAAMMAKGGKCVSV